MLGARFPGSVANQGIWRLTATRPNWSLDLAATNGRNEPVSRHRQGSWHVCLLRSPLSVENIISSVMRSTIRTIEKSGATAHEGETNALEGCHAEEFSLL